VTGLEDGNRAVEGGESIPPAGSLNPDGPESVEQVAGEPAAEAGPVEVVGLGPERQVPGHDRAEEELVGDREVVTREERAAGAGHELEALDVRPPADHQRVADGDFADRVEQRQLGFLRGQVVRKKWGGTVRLSDVTPEVPVELATRPGHSPHRRQK